MTAPAGEQLARLRSELDLKSELVRAMRAEAEQHRARETADAALVADISADIHQLLGEARRCHDQSDFGAAQHALKAAQALSSDLADCSAARSGSLVLSRRAANLRALLARVLPGRFRTLRLPDTLPVRIWADERLLERLLRLFAETHGDRIIGVIWAEGQPDEEAAALGALRLQLAQGGVDKTGNGSASNRLREAYIREVGAFLGAAMDRHALQLPLAVAEDPGATGLHRLQLNAPGSTADLPGEAADAADDAIDVVYLDQQLGSLATAVLQRTAPLFLAEAMRRLTDLHVAQQSGQAERLRTIARTWRSSALTVGARSLASLLESLERQLEGGHFPSDPMIWQVRLATDRAVRRLTERGHQPGATT